MARQSKRVRAAREKIVSGTMHPVEDALSLVKELASAIKNPRGLIADAMALMETAMDEQIKAGKAKKGQKQDPVFGELADLKVTGDKATAVMKSADGKTKPMSFAKIGDSWYLAPDMGM